MTYGYIYGLRCKVNGKWYIGQTTAEPYKYIEYQYKKRKGNGRTKMARAINYHGYDSFTICLLDSEMSREKLDNLEKEYINFYDSIQNGYNCQNGGSHGKMSDETKKKIGLSRENKPSPMLGKKHSIETIAKMRKTRKIVNNKGMILSDETKNKIRISKTGIKTGKPSWNRGIPVSEKTKKLLSDLGTGVNNSFYGKKHTMETRKKISNNKKGKTGKKHSQETLEKMRQSKIGKKRPIEVIQKMNDGRKRKRQEKLFHSQQFKELLDILLGF